MSDQMQPTHSGPAVSNRHVLLEDDNTIYTAPESTTDNDPARSGLKSGLARIFSRKKRNESERQGQFGNEGVTRPRDVRYKGTTIRYTTDEEVRDALMEFAVFIAFLILTCLVTLSVRHSYMFYFNDTMKKLFTSRELVIAPSVTVSFEKMLTIPDFWDYMIYNFIVTLHGDIVSNEVNKTSAKRNLNFGSGIVEERIFLHENLLLGPPRLRQFRVRPDSCYVNDAFIRYFNTCYAEFSVYSEDVQDFYKGAPYKTKADLDSTTVWTKLSKYDTGSYTIDLTFNRDENLAILKGLRESQWLDRGSRLCLIEFNLFNENTDLFQTAKFIAELPPTGGIIPQVSLNTIKYYSFLTDKRLAMSSVYIFWYIMVVYYSICEIGEICEYGLLNYLRSLFNILDTLILVMCYLALGYNIWHSFKIKKLVEKVQKDDSYQSLDTLGLMNLIYVDLMAILSFLVWIKIFKFISFNKTLVQFTTTLRRCAKDLAGFSLMFAIVFLAYAQLGLLLFGTKHPDFCNFLTSILTMIRMILGDFQYDLIEEANRVLGPIYFLTYILLVFFILLNMFLAIIMETYNTVKGEITQGRSQLGSYCYKKLRSLYILIRYCGKKKRNRTEQEQQQQQMQQNIENVSQEEAAASRRLQQGSQMTKNLTQAQAHYFEDVPKTVDNKDLYRLSNRVSLLEEILEQLVTNMDGILKRVEDEIKKNN